MQTLQARMKRKNDSEASDEAMKTLAKARADEKYDQERELMSLEIDIKKVELEALKKAKN